MYNVKGQNIPLFMVLILILFIVSNVKTYVIHNVKC